MKRKKELITYILCLFVVHNVCQGLLLHSEKRKDLSALLFDVHASDRDSITGSRTTLITTNPDRDFHSSPTGKLKKSAKARWKVIRPSHEVSTVQPRTFQQRDTELKSTGSDGNVGENSKKITSEAMKVKDKLSGQSLRESAMDAGTRPQKETKLKDFESKKKPDEVTESKIRKQTVKGQSFQVKIDDSLLQGEPILRKFYGPTQTRARSHIKMASHSETRLNDRRTSIARMQDSLPTATKELLSPGEVAAITVGLLAGAMVLMVIGTALWMKCENRFIGRTDPELGLASPSMTGFGEELSEEEIIFERNFKVTRSEKESSTPQSNSSSTSAPHPKSLLTT